MNKSWGGIYKICIVDGHFREISIEIGNFNLLAIILGSLVIFGAAKLYSGIIPAPVVFSLVGFQSDHGLFSVRSGLVFSQIIIIELVS
jgi:hypothetical protein